MLVRVQILTRYTNAIKHTLLSIGTILYDFIYILTIEMETQNVIYEIK